MLGSSATIDAPQVGSVAASLPNKVEALPNRTDAIRPRATIKTAKTVVLTGVIGLLPVAR
jgi:hypothetical protein